MVGSAISVYIVTVLLSQQPAIWVCLYVWVSKYAQHATCYMTLVKSERWLFEHLAKHLDNPIMWCFWTALLTLHTHIQGVWMYIFEYIDVNACTNAVYILYINYILSQYVLNIITFKHFVNRSQRYWFKSFLKTTFSIFCYSMI